MQILHFFHTSTIKRRRRNNIISLRDRVDNWITDMSLPTQHIYNNFDSCYTTEAIGSNLFPNLPRHQHAIPNSEHQLLIRPITRDEITSSIKSFEPYKTPGPDGFRPFFFQKFLTNTLPAINTLFSKIFEIEIMPSTLNQTYLWLIPKQTTSETIHQYRPINLCNTIYKIFTKIIINRLRRFLNTIIDPI